MALEFWRVGHYCGIFLGDSTYSGLISVSTESEISFRVGVSSGCHGGTVRWSSTV